MDLDATDSAILRVLQEDGRASLRTVAKKVGVSVPTVSARLRNLEALGIVRGYRAVLDPASLNEVSLALVIKVRPRSTETVAASIADFPWARRVLVGRRGSILVDVTARSQEDVETVVRTVSSLPHVLEVREFGGLRAVKDESAAVLAGPLTTTLTCFECKGPIQGEPVKVRRDGRYHYFCCHTCKRLYLERYARIRDASRTRA